ncbi:hypothetical protein L249_0304 [Ophiocordyceps polyrhachis-furcata BCC 54312]|uniref:ATP-grasp domain-containing protein n=1 Tax=Ophiocordyceps polyrhachis-furcata BCC 54312 TaxID=1330021 RepID=A0A367LGA1_9HYPO|nr:hypothetical protein L249_0304 [Ophiocordyceps polyrhachis-furcata BCC 54312]
MPVTLLARDNNDNQARFECLCRTSAATTTTTTSDPSSPTSWKCFDLHFKATSRSPHLSRPESLLFIIVDGDHHHEIRHQDFGSAAAFNFMLDCLFAANDKDGDVFARLVVPQSRGYIVRSDIISLRMLDCPLIRCLVSFCKPHQFFDGQSIVPVDDQSRQLLAVLVASAAGMRLKRLYSSIGSFFDSPWVALDVEMRNRLSFPWLSEQAPQRRTLAIVDGGITGPDSGGTGGCIYMAAEALGIDMVVLDTPNHWVNGPRFSHWRKATVPLETPLEPNPDFVDQIVKAVRSYDGHVDGIVTMRDHYKLPVAEAALQLSLPTYPPPAYEIATDKYKTSVSEGHDAYRASNAEEASAILRRENLDFPLIIKPTNGFLSEGVVRVQSLDQLEAGVQAINTQRHGKEFVMEKYCDGPEVDANLVLCDEEVLFFEASDDFPKSGDADGESFLELANVLPSTLPAKELALLQDSLRRSLLRMGFKDGFYHLEARVENSSMEYAEQNGILDLKERNVSGGKAPPSSWLVEVNPRPPGIQAAEAVRHTYGIDYFGIALLFALEDKQRVRQLSHPFLQGPQYWCEMVFIPVEKGGVFASEDVCVDLSRRRPDLAASVSESFCFMRRGDRVSDPRTGVNSWVAYFNVFSRRGRRHLLEVAEEIRREVRFSIT